MKWKCHNCGEVFESDDGFETEEFRNHSIICFDIYDFFEMIKNESFRK